MERLTNEEKAYLFDVLGKLIICDVRDGALKVAMNIATLHTPNALKRRQYSALASLSEKEQDAVCDLLSETITDVIYRMLEMIEQNDDTLRLLVRSGEDEVDCTTLCEPLGSGIACFEDDGWIQKFSKIGRFVL